MINRFEDADRIAEVSGLLLTISAQASRWQGELTQALARPRSGAGGAEAEAARLTVEQAATFLTELLAGPTREMSCVRDGEARFLDDPRVRAAVRTGSRAAVRELVSRPRSMPRVEPGQERLQVRVTWTELREIVIVDDVVALIPAAGGELTVVREPSVVQQLSQLFAVAWEHAGEAPGPEPVPPRGASESELRRQILLLLAEGAKDEAVARRLGISLRTCRRHIAEIFSHLGASSRFQAGFRTGLLGSVPGRAE